MEEDESGSEGVGDVLEHLSSWEKVFWEMLQDRKRRRGSGDGDWRGEDQMREPSA